MDQGKILLPHIFSMFLYSHDESECIYPVGLSLMGQGIVQS